MRRLTLTIISRPGNPYEIDLERMTSSSEVLDFWFQVMGKMWVDGALGCEFYHALEDACHRHFDQDAQAVFCPGGKNQTVNWKAKKIK